jgi:hypothetical protein
MQLQTDTEHTQLYFPSLLQSCRHVWMRFRAGPDPVADCFLYKAYAAKKHNKACSIWQRPPFINLLGEYRCFGITFCLHRQVCRIRSVWHSRDEGESTVRFYIAFPPGRWGHFPQKGRYPSKKLHSAITKNTTTRTGHTMEIRQKERQLIVCHNTTDCENPGKKRSEYEQV